MKKKDLLNLLPLGKVTPEIRQQIKKVKKYKYFYACKLFAKDNVLMEDIYSVDKSEVIYRGRFFITDSSYDFYNVNAEKWQKKGKDYWPSVYLNNVSVLKEFGFKKTNRPTAAIYSLQEDIKLKERRRKFSKEREEIDKVMKEIEKNKPTKAFFDFLNKQAAVNFAIYNKKAKTLYCPICNKTHDLRLFSSEKNFSDIRRGKEGKCLCGSRIIYKTKANGSEWASGSFIQKYQTGIVVRTFDIKREYKNDKLVDSRVTESFRTVISQNYYQSYEESDPHRLGVIDWNYQKPYSNIGYWRSSLTPQFKCMVYTKGIKNVLKNTDFKYLDVLKALTVLYDSKQLFSFECFTDIFAVYNDYPVIESLVNGGYDGLFKRLWNNESYYYSKPSVNKHESSICKAFNIRKDCLAILKNKYSDDNLSACRVIKNNNLSLSDLEIIKPKLRDWHFNELAMKMGSELPKALRYIEKNQISLSDYFDYIKEMEKLTYEHFISLPLFPDDFYKTHEKTSMLLTSFEEKSDRKFDKKIFKGLNFSDDKYAIVFPKDESDIVKEGLAARHCIGNGFYAEQMLDGERIILFMRKKKALDKPFASIDILIDGERRVLNQARMFANVEAEKYGHGAKEFIHAFVKAKDLEYANGYNANPKAVEEEVPAGW